jgi:hypothetical protein
MSAVAEVYGASAAVGVGSVLAVIVAGIFYVSSSALRGMDATVKAAIDADNEDQG